MGKNKVCARPVLCAVLGMIVALAAGCASSGGSSKEPSYMMNAMDAQPAPAAPAAAAESAVMEAQEYAYDTTYGYTEEATPAAAVPSQQKIIIEASLEMATDRFDEVSGQIRGVAAENDGYVQSAEQRVMYDGARWLSITLRVPYERYELAAERLKSLCVLRFATEDQRNATQEYYDIQARLDTKLIEERRLLALIERAQKIEDILELEAMLGNVRTQIELYQTQMTGIDRLASHSTIHVLLYEVKDETAVVVPENLSGRVYTSFINSINATVRFLQNVLIFLVGLSVPLFVALVAAIIIWGLFRLRRTLAKNRRTHHQKGDGDGQD